MLLHIPERKTNTDQSANQTPESDFRLPRDTVPARVVYVIILVEFRLWLSTLLLYYLYTHAQKLSWILVSLTWKTIVFFGILSDFFFFLILLLRQSLFSLALCLRLRAAECLKFCRNSIVRYLSVISFLIGFNRLSIISADSAHALCIAWAYIFVVVLALLCPRFPATVVTATPFAIWRVALVCRRECNEIRGRSVFLMNFPNQYVSVSGRIAFPLLVTKTWQCVLHSNPFSLKVFCCQAKYSRSDFRAVGGTFITR